MLKKLFVLALLVFILSSVKADVSVIVSESSKLVLQDGDVRSLGNAQPGETLHLTIASATGYEGMEWEKLVIPQNELPPGFEAVDSPKGGKTLTARIKVPVDAPKDVFQFRATALARDNAVSPETVTLRLAVKEGLLLASLAQPVKETFINEPVEFELTLINSSIADHKVSIGSNLPALWLKGQEVTVKAGEEKKVKLEIIPRIDGPKDVYFRIDSLENGEALDLIKANLKVKPELKEKYGTGFYGFPFFTLSLLPYYLINSFISLLLP
jgi:hypothetical protein